MANSLALLLVDFSDDWEDTLKAHERGFYIDDDFGVYVANRELVKKVPLDLKYPHGSIRAGFDAITDTVRTASIYQIPIYAVSMQDGWDDCFPANSIRSYIPPDNESNKWGISTFSEFDLAREDRVAHKIVKAQYSHLLIIGYDRDYCVLESARDAVKLGFKVITSEHCMLTKQKSKRRKTSMKFYEEETQHIDSLPGVWNLLREYSPLMKR